jgi:hypothetical protein
MGDSTESDASISPLRFEVWWDGCPSSEVVFVEMEQFPSLLPNLHESLVVFWQCLLDALQAHCSHLKVVRIYRLPETSPRPAKDVFAALRELVGSGMEVCTGDPPSFDFDSVPV